MGETPAIPSPAVQEFAATNSSGFKAQILQLISSGRFTGFFLFLTMWLGNQWQWVGFWYIRIGWVGGVELVKWLVDQKSWRKQKSTDEGKTRLYDVLTTSDLTQTAGWFNGDFLHRPTVSIQGEREMNEIMYKPYTPNPSTTIGSSVTSWEYRHWFSGFLQLF